MNIVRRPTLALTAIAVAFIVASSVMLTISWRNMSPEITLKILGTAGSRIVGAKTDLAGMFLTASTMFIVNLTLAETLFYRERFLSMAFLIFNLLFSILVFAAVTFVVFVN